MVFFIFAAVVSYLLGSILFGKIIAHSAGVNIQKAGSGNIGFANSWRVLGFKKAIFVLIFDVAKGYLSIAIFHNHLNLIQLYILSLAPVIGHCYPIWLNFKGGKGVATALGVVLALNPISGVIGIGVWILATVITRVAMLGSLSMMLVITISSYYLDKNIFPVIAMLLAFIVWKHRKNIIRLFDGNEPKLSWRF